MDHIWLSLRCRIFCISARRLAWLLAGTARPHLPALTSYPINVVPSIGECDQVFPRPTGDLQDPRPRPPRRPLRCGPSGSIDVRSECTDDRSDIPTRRSYSAVQNSMDMVSGPVRCKGAKKERPTCDRRDGRVNLLLPVGVVDVVVSWLFLLDPHDSYEIPPHLCTVQPLQL